MYDEFLRRVANRRPLSLCVQNDSTRHFEVGGFIHKDMAISGSGLNDRNQRVLHHVSYESRAAARDDDVHQASRANEFLYTFAAA